MKQSTCFNLGFCLFGIVDSTIIFRHANKNTVIGNASIARFWCVFIRWCELYVAQSWNLVENWLLWFTFRIVGRISKWNVYFYQKRWWLEAETQTAHHHHCFSLWLRMRTSTDWLKNSMKQIEWVHNEWMSVLLTNMIVVWDFTWNMPNVSMVKL